MTTVNDENPVRLEPNHRRLRVARRRRGGGRHDPIAVPVRARAPAGVLLPEGRRPVRLAAAHRSHHPLPAYKGDAEYWSIVVGDRRIDERGVGLPGSPRRNAGPVGVRAFYWNKVDNWFEEDEEVFVHARDPYKRVDALRSSRHVEVRVNGETVADTTRPSSLFETGLTDPLLHPQDRRSAGSVACLRRDDVVPVQGNGQLLLASPCPAPRSSRTSPGCTARRFRRSRRSRTMVCFFNEHVDIVVDGDLQERPTTVGRRRAMMTE